MITRGMTVAFYVAIVFWLTMNDFARKLLYDTLASRLIVSILQIMPALVLVGSTLSLRY